MRTLRQGVAEILDFVKDTRASERIRLDGLALRSLENDISVAYRGILQPHALPAALSKEKPGLNVEDVYE